MCPTAEAFFDTDLSGAARLVLQALNWHRNRKTGQCNPRQSTLAKELGFCRETICRAVVELRRKGRISSHKGQRGCRYELVSRQRPLSGNVTAETHSDVSECHSTLSENVTAETAPSLYEPLEVNISEPPAAHSCSGIGAAAPPPAAPPPAAPPPAALRTPTPAPPPPSCQLNLPLQRECTPHPSPERKPPQSSINPHTATHDPKAVALHAELAAAHPQPGQYYRGLAAVETALESSADRSGMEDRLRASHACWRRFWASSDGFIPQLWRWVESGDWMTAPMTAEDRRREEVLRLLDEVA